eukprot:8210443-Pyramimonas_sp.AAC.1
MNGIRVGFAAALAALVGRSVASPWSQTERAPKAATTQGRSSDVKGFAASSKWSRQVGELSDAGFE